MDGVPDGLKETIESFRENVVPFRVSEIELCPLFWNGVQMWVSLTIVLNVGFVSNFSPTKIGNVSDIGGNVSRNAVNLRKSMKIVKKF